MQNNTADRLSCKQGEPIVQSATIEGFFMIDGQLVRLDNEGRIIHPVMTLGKDIPIHSVFEMNNPNKNHRDA